MNLEQLELSIASHVLRAKALFAGRAGAARHALLCLTLLIACSGLTLNLSALAIPDDLRINALNPGVPQSPPGVPVPPGAPPPPGSGDNATGVTPGDQGVSSGPPSGAVDMTNGTKFGDEPEKVINLTRYKMDVPGTAKTGRLQPSGPHNVLINNTGGGGEQGATDASLAAMQDRQYPSPNKNIGASGKKELSLDYEQPPKKQTSPPFQVKRELLREGSRLIKVRPFARFLVKLGVVFATVMMIMAAFAVIKGHRDGGARVISTVGGLILLLMAYTIWKQVILNTRYLGNFPPNNPDQIYPLPEPNRVAPQPADTPVTPGATADNRSNMKVLPLGAKVLR